VKFHFDNVTGLGTFMEVEAIDDKGVISTENLKEQCEKYFLYFGLRESDFVDKSYSDLLLDK
jgi:adenylate cyclase class 2